MDDETRKRMEAVLAQQHRSVMSSLASGWCENEEDEEGPAVINYDPEAVLWLLANPYGPKDELQHRAINLLLERLPAKDKFKLAADLTVQDIPGVVKWRRPGVKEENTAEFMRAFRAGTQEVMRETGLPRKEAEWEWFWRKAEMETGTKRTPAYSEASDADAKPPLQVELKRVQRKHYMRAYNNSSE